MNKKKIIMILCICLATSLFIRSIPEAFAYEKIVELHVDDQIVDTITLNQYEKKSVKLKTSINNIESCEWQLLNEKDGSWINIYGWQGNECNISYALVKSILHNNHSVIRVIITNKEGRYHSNSIAINIENKPSDKSHVTAYNSMLKNINTTNNEVENDNKATITIHYLEMASLNGERFEIAKPYVVEVDKGSNFQKKVKSPEIAGYKPYYNPNTTVDSEASVVELDYQNIDKNIDIDVYYQPITVNYAIKYLFENIQDEKYQEDKSRYYQGKGEANAIISNEYLKQNAGNTEGFEMIQPEINSIKDDGSSVIECYFDRSYYLMQFDLNKGQGIKPIYARYQTPLKLDKPTRDGYRFVGWDKLVNGVGDGISDIIPSEMPAYSSTYQAIWDNDSNIDSSVPKPYDKWQADNYQVKFFASHRDLIKYENNKDEALIYQSNNVICDSILGDISQPISSDRNAIFDGWYYMDGNVKKAYIPQETVINKNMNVFADWVKDGQHQYVIRHVLLDNQSIKVADDVIGYGNLNDDINCIAKVGNPKNELYDEYNQGYYPTAANGNITISNDGLNEYTFYYVQAEDVSYTVKYLGSIANLTLLTPVTKYVNQGYVSERFKPILGRTPDAFYKSLVLSVVWDDTQGKYVGSPDNVITFYYYIDIYYSRYAIHYMVEKSFDPSLSQAEIEQLRNQYYIDGSGGYEEYRVEDKIAFNSGTAHIYPDHIEGYEFIENNHVPISVINGNESVVKKSGNHYNLNITHSGSEIYLFYRKIPSEVGTLTISRKSASDDKQVFRYEIRNNDTDECTYVSVVGNSEVVIYDIPYGSYTVTQDNEWSWRYNDEPQTITINSNNNVVTVDDTAVSNMWLNANSDLLHNQGR